MTLMGRPAGSFEKKSNELLSLLKNAPEDGNTSLARKMSVSEGSIKRYLNSLTKRGAITTSVSRVKLGAGWYNVRNIEVTL